MFCCCSKNKYDRIPTGYDADPVVKDKRKSVARQSLKVVDLLILGPGESGKSTVCRQLVYMSKNGIPESEIPTIHENMIKNILSGTQELLDAMKTYQYNFTSPGCVKAAERMSSADKDSPILTPEMVNDIKMIFDDEGARQALRRRNEFGLQETVLYFIGKIDDIAKPDYIPTWKDAVNVRNKTTQVTSYNFTFKGFAFRLTDVGGQRKEREEWMDYFERAFMTIFVVSLADFDMSLREDPSINRMTEAIKLFGLISKNEILSEKDIILFLNKKDIFKKKLETTSISVLFPDYKGPRDYVESIQFIRDKFLQASGRRDLNSIRAFVTMATDTTCMSKVFNAVHDRVVQITASRMLM